MTLSSVDTPSTYKQRQMTALLRTISLLEPAALMPASPAAFHCLIFRHHVRTLPVYSVACISRPCGDIFRVSTILRRHLCSLGCLGTTRAVILQQLVETSVRWIGALPAFPNTDTHTHTNSCRANASATWPSTPAPLKDYCFMASYLYAVLSQGFHIAPDDHTTFVYSMCTSLAPAAAVLG